MWPLILMLAGNLAMLMACAYALWRGDWPERCSAMMIALAWIGSYLLQDRSRNYDPQYWVAGLDVLLFVAFVVLTLRWRRLWLIVASATQLLTAATHMAFVIDSRIAALGFMTAYYLWSYATLAALVWGSWQAARARAPARNTAET
jgi:hypothetical protein